MTAVRRHLRRPTLPMAVLAALGIALFALGAGPVAAHEGHDHGAPPVAAFTQVTPRVEAVSDVFELVGIVRGDEMVIFLDRFDSNEPVTGAVIEVSGAGEAVRAQAQPDGSYVVPAPWLAAAGPHDLVFAIDAAGVSDLLIGTLELAEQDADLPAGGGNILELLRQTPLLWALGGAVFLMGVVLGRTLAPRQRPREPTPATASPQLVTGGAEPAKRRVGASPCLCLLAGSFLAGAAHADGGAEPSPTGARASAIVLPSGILDSPRRLGDGSLFVPKPTQRLMTVRTEQVRQREAPRTTTITGRVIADPTAGGIVQAAQAGRIEPADGGLPVIGQRVQRGQALATVAPLLTTLERSAVEEQLAQLDGSIALAEERLARLSQLQGSVPQRDILETRRELQGLRQRRQALAPALAQREVVRASATGVISVANVVNGQLVDAGEILYEIVDPEKLWVEAIAYDPADVAEVGAATAVTASGEALALALVGRSLTLRQQAVPVQFRVVEPSPTLKVGTPVTVIIAAAQAERGILLPVASVVATANGERVVFEHVSPERFLPRPVRTRPLDGRRVVVVAGIAEGARIVTEGAELLNQIR